MRERQFYIVTRSEVGRLTVAFFLPILRLLWSASMLKAKHSRGTADSTSMFVGGLFITEEAREREGERSEREREREREARGEWRPRHRTTPARSALEASRTPAKPIVPIGSAVRPNALLPFLCYRISNPSLRL